MFARRVVFQQPLLSLPTFTENRSPHDLSVGWGDSNFDDCRLTEEVRRLDVRMSEQSTAIRAYNLALDKEADALRALHGSIEKARDALGGLEMKVGRIASIISDTGS